MIGTEAVLYIHGKGGGKEEAEHYRPLFPSRCVYGADCDVSSPGKAAEAIRDSAEKLKKEYGSVIIVANSIGAYFTMIAGIDDIIRRAYFISPIVDMEKLIRDMMRYSGVTESQLREKGAVTTPSGDELSWRYLSFVRRNPIKWSAPTFILYGEDDTLTSYETVTAFADSHNAELTVMKNGEHWFHTEEQMRFLDEWIINTEIKHE